MNLKIKEFLSEMKSPDSAYLRSESPNNISFNDNYPLDVFQNNKFLRETTDKNNAVTEKSNTPTFHLDSVLYFDEFACERECLQDRSK